MHGLFLRPAFAGVRQENRSQGSKKPLACAILTVNEGIGRTLFDRPSLTTAVFRGSTSAAPATEQGGLGKDKLPGIEY